MIIDVQRFVETERKHWRKLEAMLQKLEADPEFRMDLAGLQEFHHLYRRTSADLVKISTFASEREIRGYLESLVARAYGEIHETREKPHHLRPVQWFFQTFPRTFRRYIGCFWLSLAVTVLGALFGGGAMALDPESKEIMMPFSHLQGDPSQRVAEEEKNVDGASGGKATFSSYLMTHNTKVSITTLALGMIWGIGTVLTLFYNGLILGAVTMDYCMAGEVRFLAGWLLPHGAVEIPAILLAGQAGFLLGGTIIGWGSRVPLRKRLRSIATDIATFVGGIAILLIWAGLIEGFLSQYHEPVLPYGVKILFGCLELGLLIAFLAGSGRERPASLPNT